MWASAASTSGGVRSRSLRRSFQEVGERRRVEALRSVRLVACLRPRLVEGTLQFSDTLRTIRLRALAPLLERIYAPPQLADHLAPSFGERERLFPGGGELRAPPEVQVEGDTRYGRKSRQCGDDRGEDRRHPAQARDLILRARGQKG